MRKTDTDKGEIAAVANDHGWHYEVVAVREHPREIELRMTRGTRGEYVNVIFSGRDGKLVRTSGAINLTKSDHSKRPRLLAVLKGGFVVE